MTAKLTMYTGKHKQAGRQAGKHASIGKLIIKQKNPFFKFNFQPSVSAFLI